MDPLNNTPPHKEIKLEHTKHTASNAPMLRYDDHNSRSVDDTLSITQFKSLVELALEFLSTSSNEKLLCVLGCVTVATYLLLGRLGLLLIGVAIGVTIHSSWEGLNNDYSLDLRTSSRREHSLIIIRKLLDQQASRPIKTDPNFNNDGNGVTKREPSTELDAAIFGPATAAALKSLIDAAVKDYVNYWYEPILPSESTFPLSCRKTLTGFITSISSHLYRKRTADTFLAFLTNSSSMVIVFLNELSAAFELNSHPSSPEQTIMHYLETHPEGSLSSILANEQQRRKLNMISDHILSNFLDSQAYDCPALKNFLREVLSGVVFESVIASMSRPEFINGWIVHLFSEGESEIMSAIDAGVEGARTHGVAVTDSTSDGDRQLASPANSRVTDSTSPSDIIKKESTKVDRATEEALEEAKRLSDMIAAQNLQVYHGHHSDPRKQPRSRDDSEPLLNVEGGSEVGENKIYHSPNLEAQPTRRIHESESRLDSLVSQSGNPPSLSSVQPPKSPLGPSHPESNPESVLHFASVTVDDGLGPEEKGPLRSKPTSNFLLQVEPLLTRSTGWMVFKKYSDFEAIHETLRTISRLNNIRSFPDDHPVVPQWRGQTRKTLARNLEQYVQDALQHEPLAESERMRRFLEKDGGLGTESGGASTKSGFFFPSQVAFENVGKGVLGVLANAPKGVSGGSKAVFEGVTGVFSGGTNKRGSLLGSSAGRSSKESGLPSRATEPVHNRPEEATDLSQDSNPKSTLADSLPLPRSLEQDGSGIEPAPDETPKKVLLGTSVNATDSESNITSVPAAKTSSSSDSVCENNNSPSSSEAEETEGSGFAMTDSAEITKETPAKIARRNQSKPITHDETRIAVELIFAVINELYSLSSAWAIRRTLLNAAKSYILRPGNPSLETIRSLLQDSMIDSNIADESIALYLKKIRENALPTEEELDSWPSSLSDAEKDRLRGNARRVLVQKGLPQAITGVMGAAASREALGKVFDCLQVEPISRGLVYAIFLQGLSAVLL